MWQFWSWEEYADPGETSNISYGQERQMYVLRSSNGHILMYGTMYMYLCAHCMMGHSKNVFTTLVSNLHYITHIYYLLRNKYNCILYHFLVTRYTALNN